MNKPIAILAAMFAASCASAALKTAADYDVGDYVQEGLVAHYDGIRNAGANLPHDPEATQWVDLVGGNDMAFMGTNDEAAATGTWANGNSYDFAYSYALMAETVDLGENITIQLVLEADLDAQAAAYAATGNNRCTWATYFGHNNADWGVFTRPGSRSALEWKNDTWCGTRAKATRWAGRFINAISTADYSYVGQNPSYENATARTKVAAFDGYRWSIGGAHYLSGGVPAKNGIDQRLTMSRYYSARFYSRPLTEDELVQNRKVDDIRFFGAVYTNVVVEASPYAGVAGAEAAGVYEVFGSHTFTAPDVTAGGVTYSAVGYTVEEWNGSYWASGSRFEGNSYTYAKTDDAPAVRLTWLWKPVRGIRAAGSWDANDYVAGGLVAQYDGIRNLGADLPHDAGATVWRDLKSSNYMTFEGTNAEAAATGSWAGGNAYSFAGYSYARMAEALSMGSNITVQIAADIDNNAQIAAFTADSTRIRTPNYFAAGTDYGAFANIYSTTQRRLIQWKGDLWVGSRAGDRAAVNGWNLKYLTAMATDDKAYLFEDTDPDAVKAGKVIFTRTKFLPFSDIRWTVGGSHYDTTAYEYSLNINQRLSIGKFHSVRFYNRPLTEDELVWNRMVDEKRFRGVVATNVVVASSKAGVEGVQPNGVYEVLEEGAFTAEPVPAMTPDGAHFTFVPSGYTLEYWDGASWGEPQEHPGSSYTYVSEDEGDAIVRLTWKWHAAGLGTFLMLR